MSPIHDMNILVIDDSAIDRKLLQIHLSKHQKNISFIEADSGNSALEAISQEKFDCIFLDYILPDTDGITLLRRINEEKLLIQPCPIIMLTGQGNESIMIDAIHYGAQDYVVKNNISAESLEISIRKSQEVLELKQHRRETQSRLSQSQKMEAIGQLTGGIAHDFNNLLTIIFGNTRILETLLSKDGELNKEQALDKVNAIRRSAERGADLVKHLMVFARQKELTPEHTDINALIGDIQNMLNRTIGNDIEFKTELAKNAWPVYVDANQLEHVIINMAVNARDAMIDGGVFSIKTENVTVIDDDKDIDLKPGQYTVISLTDTGQGMDQETIDQIFDPFFTTKDIGKGTGLGLSMVYGFLKDSGGNIHVESEIGKGTSFKLYLPKSDIENFKSSETTTTSSSTGGNETILLVEDEPEIRELTENLLKSEGYTVLTAQNGEEALKNLIDNKDNIDLIFTDISMPGGMNGIQMVARAEAIRKDLKILFTTGYTKENMPDYDLIHKDYAVLSKPYNHQEALVMIRNILDT